MSLSASLTLSLSLFPPPSISPCFSLLVLSQPGDRVQIIGNYRCLPSKRSGYTTGTFRTVLLATNVITLSKEVAPLFSARDVAKIKRFSRSKQYDPFEMLAHSLAPSIHGHDYIKKAVLCMLLGGVEKILENGTRLRGWVQLRVCVCVCVCECEWLDVCETERVGAAVMCGVWVCKLSNSWI